MYIFQASPPEILVDFNMTDERGTLPALARHIRGLRPDGLYVGQRMTAVDADEITAEAVIYSMDGELLRLFLLPPVPSGTIQAEGPELATGQFEIGSHSGPVDVHDVRGNPEPLVVA